MQFEQLKESVHIFTSLLEPFHFILAQSKHERCYNWTAQTLCDWMVNIKQGCLSHSSR